MKTNMQLFSHKAALPALLATGLFAATLNAAPPVDPASHAAHVAAGTMPPDAPATTDAVKGDPALAGQVSGLQAKIAQLEGKLVMAAPTMAAAPASAAMPGMPAPAPAAAPAPAMGMDKMKPAAPMAGMAPGGMMGMMNKMMGMMDKMMSMGGGAMPASGAPMPAGGMGMDQMPMGGSSMTAAAPTAAMPANGGGMGKMAMDKMEVTGMMGMDPMGSSAPGAMPQSALPGFPGASHLYHLGATDFFLDHQTHIVLTTEQTAALNQAKEKATLAKSTADRTIEQAEQELWSLTASDQPDITAIEAKSAKIGKLTSDTRVAFIRSIGEASKLLTDEQRKILTGFAPPAPAPSAAPMAPMSGTDPAAPAAGMATPAPAMPAGGMSDM